MFMSPKQVSTFAKYNPEKLAIGWKDIKLKKISTRAERNGTLAYDQKYLKQYTAYSGAIAIEISERAREAGYGHTEVAELYHFMAQTALNMKHRRDGKDLIDALSNHFLRGTKPLKMEQFINICQQLNPYLTEKNIRRLKGLFNAPKATNLLYTRNKISGGALQKLKEISSINMNTKSSKVVESNSLAEAHFVY
jgi:hypothetical protein